MGQQFFVIPPRKVSNITGENGVSAINNLSGAITLVAAGSITLTPSGQTLTISSTFVEDFVAVTGGSMTGNLQLTATSGAYGLGLYASTTDPSQHATGALYFNTASSKLKYWDGTEWVSVDPTGSGSISITTNSTLLGSGSPGGTVTDGGSLAINPAATLNWTGAHSFSQAITFASVQGFNAANLSITSQATGDILYYTGSAWARLPIGSAARSLIVTSGVPAWGQVDLGSGVFGTLPISRGGTNVTAVAVGDLLYAGSTSAFTRLAIGTNGQVLTITGGAPAWGDAPTGNVEGSGSTNAISYWSNSTTLAASGLTIQDTGNTMQFAGTNAVLRFNDTHEFFGIGSANGGQSAGIGVNHPILGTAGYSLSLAGGAIKINSLDADSSKFLELSYVAASGSPSTVFTVDRTGQLTAGSVPVARITGTLGAASGGTGLVSYNAGDLITATGTTTLSRLAAGTNTYVLTMMGGAPAWAAPTGSTTFLGGTLTGNLQLAAGTTSTSPLTFQSGVLLTTAAAGNMEYDGTNLYFTPTGSTRRTITYADGNITGTASNVSGVIAISHGGTGADLSSGIAVGQLPYVANTTQIALLANPSGASGKFLMSNGAAAPGWSVAITSIAATSSSAGITVTGGSTASPTLAIDVSSAFTPTWAGLQTFNAGVTLSGSALTLAAFGSGTNAPLKFQTAAPITPQEGQVWYDGSDLFFRKSGATVNLTTVASAPAATATTSGTVKTDTTVSTPVVYLKASVDTLLGGYEPTLGNPSATGYILSSTSVGVRSWIPFTKTRTGTIALIAGLTPTQSTDDVVKFPVPPGPGGASVTYTFVQIVFRAETAPSGGSATMNVKLNGSNILSSALSVTTGTNSASTTSFSTTTCTTGDLLQVSMGTVNSSDQWGVYVTLSATY